MKDITGAGGLLSNYDWIVEDDSTNGNMVEERDKWETGAERSSLGSPLFLLRGALYILEAAKVISKDHQQRDLSLFAVLALGMLKSMQKKIIYNFKEKD